MKNMQYQLIALLFIVLTCSQFGYSQDPLMSGLWYEVYKVYPPLSITKEKLSEAQTLLDLNKNYKSAWVREYLSVEISAIHEGRPKKATGKNSTLSQEQKDLMNKADVGTAISVVVQYIPENNLKQNDPKQMDFTFVLDPEIEAKYADGSQQLKEYLKEKAIDKIPEGQFKGFDLVVVKFTISEEGEIINPHLFETAKDKQTNALLLETIRNMPCWKPAEYANGTKVKQEYALAIGNKESCVMNLLNIRQD